MRLDRVDLGRLERANVELQAVAELLDAPEHTDRVPLDESSIEQLDVIPDTRLDPARRVDELEREVRGAALRAKLSLGLDGKNTLDDPVCNEVGDHSASLSVESGSLSACPPSRRFALSATTWRWQAH